MCCAEDSPIPDRPGPSRSRVRPVVIETPVARTAPNPITDEQLESQHQADHKRLAASLLKPLPRAELRAMAMRMVRAAESVEIALGKLDRHRKGPALRAELEKVEAFLRTSRRKDAERFHAELAGDPMEWIDHVYVGDGGRQHARSSRTLDMRMPPLPTQSQADETRRLRDEQERRDHPERFITYSAEQWESERVRLDGLRAAARAGRSDPAKLNERAMGGTEPTAEASLLSNQEVRAIIAEVRYEQRGELIERTTAARKKEKARKLTRLRVKKHRQAAKVDPR